jgi:formate dehydrogenase iron-sulfur subunit
MEIDRRRFLQTCGLTAITMALPSGSASAAPPQIATGQRMAVLSDLTRCIGCGWCQEACREWNSLPRSSAGAGFNPDEATCLSAETWTVPEMHEIEQDGHLHRIFVKRQCMHCEDPACVSACPVGALQKLENGAVVYDCTRCIGCRYCMVACPFSIPKFEWEERLPRIRKCTFCADRQAEGLVPACVAACPADALTFGQRDLLLAEAQARIEADPNRYHDHIYGQDELGGTSWLYLAPVSFEQLGFPALAPEPVTALSETVATYGTAGVAASVSLLLGGLYYWFNGRRQPPYLEPSPEEREADR